MLFIFLFLLFAVEPAFAQPAPKVEIVMGQEKSGTLAGKVIGLDGEEVSKAPIEAKSIESGRIFKTASAVNGSYSLTELPEGRYEMSSPIAGFEHKQVEVRAGETTRTDIRFVEPGPTLGTIGDSDLAARIARYNRPAPPSGLTPRTPTGQPDFSGYWQNAKVDAAKPEMQAWAEALAKYRVDNDIKDSPSARCLPDGVLRLDQLIQTPSYLIVLVELSTQSHRLVFLDGREHPKDVDPTWYGHSVGRWDGDTLVVDRVGFNEGTWLGGGQGLPHTDRLHLVERFRRPDLGHLEVETTIEDAGAYQRPWTRKVTFELRPNQEVHEYVCENNLDPANMVGK